MNLIVGSPLWLIIALVAAIAAAAVEDAIRLRISNITCLVVLVAAIVAMVLHGFPLALWQNVVVFMAVLAVGTAVFAAGHMGGGDVKLLACLALWMNFAAAAWLLATTFIAGGILALGFIVARLVPRGRRGGRPERERRIPYGLAIASGAALIFAGQLGFLRTAPQPPNAYAITR